MQIPRSTLDYYCAEMELAAFKHVGAAAESWSVTGWWTESWWITCRRVGSQNSSKWKYGLSNHSGRVYPPPTTLTAEPTNVMKYLRQTVKACFLSLSADVMLRELRDMVFIWSGVFECTEVQSQLHARITKCHWCNASVCLIQRPVWKTDMASICEE